jgi:hypothetical protein
VLLQLDRVHVHCVSLRRGSGFDYPASGRANTVLRAGAAYEPPEPGGLVQLDVTDLRVPDAFRPIGVSRLRTGWAPRRGDRRSVGCGPRWGLRCRR